MPVNRTEHYQLNLWKPEDKVLREDFVQDNLNLEAALSGLAEGKADRSALAALQTAVNSKASQSSLNSLSSTVSGHAAALTKKGNCRIETFSYTGNGTSGSGGTTNITFSAKPVCFFIFSSSYLLFSGGPDGERGAIINVNGAARVSQLGMSWSGNQCRLSSSDAEIQANDSGSVYQVIAFYAQDSN